MNVIRLTRKVNTRIRKRGPLDTFAAAWNILTGLADYYFNPLVLRTGNIAPLDHKRIVLEMIHAGLKVIPYRVNVTAFQEWLKRAAFPNYYVASYADLFIEKALEHYVSADLLNLKSGKIFIDIGASSSPWLNTSSRLYGLTAMALDLNPPTTPVPGNKVAGDATRMPFPDNSVDAMALHCAYETFEGDADSLLVREAERVLRRGGKMVILPLYMHHLYYADSSPGADRRGIDYQGARRVWREERNAQITWGSGVRFSRKYDVQAFIERVVRYKESLGLTIRFVENEREVDPICYLKFIAVFEKSYRNL